jgi:hypothetical protein
MLDLQAINEQLEERAINITFYENTDTTWQFLLGAGGDVEIADLIYPVSLMVIKGKGIRSRDKFVVVDYQDYLITTLEDEDALLDYFRGIMTEATAKESE